MDINTIIDFLREDFFTTNGALWTVVLFAGYSAYAIQKGLKSGDWYAAAQKFFQDILHEDSEVENFLEKHIATWSEEKKATFLTIADVLNPLTETTITDVDDKMLADIRQLFEVPDINTPSAPLG